MSACAGGLAACTTADTTSGTGPSATATAEGSSFYRGPACPELPTFTTPPSRAVALDGGTAALLVALGLSERIVGIGRTKTIRNYPDGIRQQLEAPPSLAEDAANRESVLLARPDVVVGSSLYQFGSFPGTATLEDLERAKIKPLGSLPAVHATHG